MSRIMSGRGQQSCDSFKLNPRRKHKDFGDEKRWRDSWISQEVDPVYILSSKSAPTFIAQAKVSDSRSSYIPH